MLSFKFRPAFLYNLKIIQNPITPLCILYININPHKSRYVSVYPKVYPNKPLIGFTLQTRVMFYPMKYSGTIIYPSYPQSTYHPFHPHCW